MPVILPPEAYDEWLNTDTNGATLLSLLQPAEWPGMSCHPVSTEVNRAANDHPALMERAVREMQFDNDRRLRFMKDAATTGLHNGREDTAQQTERQPAAAQHEILWATH